MKKITLYLFSLIIISFVTFVAYLSFYGHETDRFNNIIKSEIKKKEKNINLNFSKISILLDIKKLNLFIKFVSPEIEYQSVKIPLDSLRANVELDSLLKNKIVIKNIIITSKYLNFNLIKPLIIQSNLYKYNLNTLAKIEKSQIKIRGDFNFNKNFDLKNDFNLSGRVKNTNFKYDKNNRISNLNFNFAYNQKEGLRLKDLSSNYNNIKIINGKINFEDLKGNITLDINTKIRFEDNKNELLIIKKKFIKKENYSLRTILTFKKNKNILIKEFMMKNNDNVFEIKNLILDKKYTLLNFEKINIKTKENEKINNDFTIKNEGTIIVQGKIFDATILLKELDNQDQKNNFLKKFSKDIEADFKKVLTNTEFPLNKFRMVGLIKKGKFEKISAKSEFGNDKYLDISIKKQKNTNESVVEIYSDIAKPLVNSYEFFQGLEGGNLTYLSKSNNNNSSGVIEIRNFKLNNAPALAKLLSLADLKGLTDALKGEGISFDSLSIKYKNSSTWMDINEIFLTGPSISFLMDGYFDKKNDILSLRGTLVPAKTLNSVVSKIPVVGDILIGKKVGEGVFGVSFKIKGPTKNLKTTVNPIKTLTPRFITRALEDLKKKQTK